MKKKEKEERTDAVLCLGEKKRKRKIDPDLKGNIDAAEEIVLVATSGGLGDLLEEPAESFDAPYFVQLAHSIQDGIFVVVIPVTMRQMGRK